MNSKKDLRKQVVIAAKEYGIGAVLFRNAVGGKLGINITDIGCLNFLFIKTTSSPTELAHYTGLTTGSTTAMLDRLEKAKLIIRKPNPSDRRGILIEISQHAREVVVPMVSSAQKAQNELLASYTFEELATIADFLNRSTSHMRKQAKIIGRNPSE